MVSVFGFTELLLNRPVPEAKRRDVLETIHRQASLLINMVNELLDLARIEARQGKDLKREPHPLGDLIERTVHALMVHGDPRTVVQDVRHGTLALSVDAEKTVQALTNVLSNAYKYKPRGRRDPAAHAGRSGGAAARRWACASATRASACRPIRPPACSSASTAPTLRATSRAPAWA